jgi:hypothetical protein
MFQFFSGSVKSNFISIIQVYNKKSGSLCFKRQARACRGSRHGAGCQKETHQLQDRFQFLYADFRRINLATAAVKQIFLQKPNVVAAVEKQTKTTKTRHKAIQIPFAFNIYVSVGENVLERPKGVYARAYRVSL